MEHITYDCVHTGCGAKNMTHTVVSTSPGPALLGRATWNIFLTCRKCQRGTIIYAADQERRGLRPADHDERTFEQFFTIFGSAPEQTKAAIVEELPENVRGPWIEAEFSFAQGHPGTAAMAYRRVLERSLRTEHPDLNGNLADRIKALKGSVPDAIVDMANQVRFLGNDGAHEEKDPDIEDVTDGRDFVRLYLVYTYELPARINRAVKARAERKLNKQT